MKRTLVVLAVAAFAGATASAEIVKVYLQVEGCLRTTCSRKVWQALGRSVPSSNFKVDDSTEGIAEFVPKPHTSLSLRALNRSIHDAGYSVKRVAIEVDGKNDLAVAKQDCSRERLPELWVKQAQNSSLYSWTPGQEDLKRKTDEGVQVCVVH
jgi:hypothetical protein